MSPDQISVVTTLLTLIGKLSGWPFAVLLFIYVIGPWLLAMLLSHFQGKRFESVVRMYENNVKLVEDYEALSKDLKEIIIMNTQAVTKLNDGIEQNQFCPMVRLEKAAKGVVQ